jgi:hypothetical protein
MFSSYPPPLGALLLPPPPLPLQQLCTFPALATSVSDLVSTLLRGCLDTVPNVRLVAAQFVSEVVLAGGIPRDRVASEIKYDARPWVASDTPPLPLPPPPYTHNPFEGPLLGCLGNVPSRAAPSSCTLLLPPPSPCLTPFPVPGPA